MSTFLPLFPLGLVVFPGEQLHLHIFEPRYKQLINDCADSALTFGIPAIIEKKVCDTGTVVRLQEIQKVFPNGEMDVITRGVEVFRLTGPVKKAGSKLYSGANVEYPPNNLTSSGSRMKDLLLATRKLHATLQIKKTFARPDADLTSYDIAHHVGLALPAEYRLLCLLDEDERQIYLEKHLRKILPAAEEIESLKERVKLNGHFKMTSGTEWE